MIEKDSDEEGDEVDEKTVITVLNAFKEEIFASMIKH